MCVRACVRVCVRVCVCVCLCVCLSVCLVGVKVNVPAERVAGKATKASGLHRGSFSLCVEELETLLRSTNLRPSHHRSPGGDNSRMSQCSTTHLEN